MWQETITLTMGYNYRTATWTCLWLPIFVINIVLSSMFLFTIHKCKQAVAKVDRLTTSQTEVRDDIGDPELSECTPLLQSNSSRHPKTQNLMWS